MPVPKEKKYTAEDYFNLTPEDSGERYELYDGELSALAAPNRIHQKIVTGIGAAFWNHIKINKGKCETFVAPFDVRLDDCNVVQPDVLVVCDTDKLDDKRCSGAPDLVVEVMSESNKHNDLVKKLGLYIRYGVREYWIVDPDNEKTLVYFFEKSEFPNIYTFGADIPVGIFGGSLNINIAGLLA